MLPRPRLLLGFSLTAFFVLLAGLSPLFAHKPAAGAACNGPQPLTPGSGCLFTLGLKGDRAFVLRHTDVKAQISGNIARVEVRQTFENPFSDPLEAIYVFPLPDESAVDEMEIRIGERVIKGDIKKREEAQKIYQQAKNQGRTAGLLEQQRDNIFTQSLANIRPGEQIEVRIRYSESVKFEKGDYEFVFPMVVGPRYIPGKAIDGSGDTDRVPDASTIRPPYLRSEERSGHDIAVAVTIDAGVPVETVQSTSHTIRVQRQGRLLAVKLAAADTIPNKDLILRYRVSGERTRPTVLTQSGDRGGHFAAYLIPAIRYQPNEIVPKDVVFLMDTSGSQSGDPIVKSQELMRRFIAGLHPQDTFSIVNFSDTTDELAAAPLANTAANRKLALAYIARLNANGGTELLNGIRKVLSFAAAKDGGLRSIVLLTDGYIGDDKRVIAEVQRHLAPGNRLYTFGVGSSVNRYLIDRLAEVGRGTARVVRQDEPTAAVAQHFFEQINSPVLTDVQVSWQGEGAPPEIYPHALPDLFANQPLVLFGRKADSRPGTLRITGTAAGGVPFSQSVAVPFHSEPNNPAIAQLWGRARLKDLTNQMVAGDTKSGVEAVTRTALAYHLLSEYTAFVAVSEEVRVDPTGERRTVQVPVPTPEGVDYERSGAADAAGGYARARFTPIGFLCRSPSPCPSPHRGGYQRGCSPAAATGSGDPGDGGDRSGRSGASGSRGSLEELETAGRSG